MATVTEVNYVTASQAVDLVRNGNRIFVQGGAATPLTLLRALYERTDIRDIELVSISLQGARDILEQGKDRNIFINSLFVSENVRHLVNGHNGDYVPVFLSEIHQLFDRGIMPLDVALIHVSPPDRHGYCSLGTSVDISRAAIRSARKVIAQVNQKMPRTHGDGIIHVKNIDFFTSCDEDLPEVDYSKKVDETSVNIGRRCAELIEDRATLQMGIGSIPDAVMSFLHSHKDIGIHTEMLSDGILPLIERGVITNKYKKKHRGKVVTGFAVGTRKLYDYIDDNPQFAFLDIAYVNDTRVISANPGVVAINSAIEIDLTGQICADSLGMKQYSGVGGQMDFIRGAALSENGKPVIAMPSVTKHGKSRIVPFLTEGSGVVTTRAHVHHVVTEYGSVNLFGKNLRQRAVALAGIAHPNHREWLDKAIFERFGAAGKFISLNINP